MSFVDFKMQGLAKILAGKNI